MPFTRKEFLNLVCTFYLELCGILAVNRLISYRDSSYCTAVIIDLQIADQRIYNHIIDLIKTAPATQPGL